jgi:hypothetical protein
MRRKRFPCRAFRVVELARIWTNAETSFGQTLGRFYRATVRCLMRNCGCLERCVHRLARKCEARIGTGLYHHIFLRPFDAPVEHGKILKQTWQCRTAHAEAHHNRWQLGIRPVEPLPWDKGPKCAHRTKAESCPLHCPLLAENAVLTLSRVAWLREGFK